MNNKVLAQGLTWFIRLRWGAAVAISGSSFLFRGDPSLSLTLLCAGAVIAAYNSVFIWGRKKKGWSGKVFAHFQILLDWCSLGSLAYLSGKAGSPMIPFFIFHVIIANVLLERTEAMLHTTVAVGMVLGLRIAFPRQSPYPWQEQSFVFSGAQVPVSFPVLLFTFYTAAYLTGTVGRMVKEREEDLQSAYTKLEFEDKEKTRFLLTSAHSLRSPLTTIETMIQSFLHTSGQESGQKTREVLEKILNRASQLSQIVKDLLELASARELKRDKMEPVDLPEVMKSAIEKLRGKTEGKGISIILGSDPGSYRIEGSREEWERVFENLLDNAIKYTLSGKNISAHFTRNGRKMSFTIRDYGIGIEKGDLKKIFQEFFRAENARAVTDEGTGLGLSIVKRIVEKQGGNIGIESVLRHGTAVTIELPADEAEKNA